MPCDILEGDSPQTSRLKMIFLVLFIFLLIGLSVAGVHMGLVNHDSINFRNVKK